LETAGAVVVIDPWLSPHGAFDYAWFQYPRNHHLAPFVQEKLADRGRERFVYISHEHQDHFDRAFLSQLDCRDLTFLVPRFQRTALRSAVAEFAPKRVIACEHGEMVPIPGGYARLYLEDSGLNRDSALLVRADEGSFLNLNDCKLYDELAGIIRQEPEISVFTCQFSGATWHPICYDYSPQEYEDISRRKIRSKFETVARAIETVKPRAYIPSAGPPCFLDPMLMHLNFERTNVFPRTPKFLEFLSRRLPLSSTQMVGMMPGDVLDVGTGNWIEQGTERPSEENLEGYITCYAKKYASVFAEREHKPLHRELGALLDMLQFELEQKLSRLSLRDRVNVPLYFGISDANCAMLRIDFLAGIVEQVDAISGEDYYTLKAPAWQVARILEGQITWEDFALTFRMRLNRRPDIYQTLVQGFLLMEPEDMNWFCAQLLEIEQRNKRVVIEAGGTRFSIDRYCPHGGADLSQGWSQEGRHWICPRHRWEFALDKGGQCLSSNASIHAICLESDP
jgi:UDP-MurNAc hydroxylase